MEVGACEALPGPRGPKGCVLVQTEFSGSPSQDEAHRAVHSLTACCGLNGSPPQNSYVGAQYPRRWY